MTRKRSLRTAAVGPAKKFGEKTWAEWERLYVRERRTLREIAEQYGVAPSTIMRRLHGRGVECRPAPPPRKLTTAAAARAGAAGLSGVEVAEVAGVSHTTVHRRLREYFGLPPMPSDVAPRGRRS